jgi:hypothetical protein
VLLEVYGRQVRHRVLKGGLHGGTIRTLHAKEDLDSELVHILPRTVSISRVEGNVARSEGRQQGVICMVLRSRKCTVKVYIQVILHHKSWRVYVCEGRGRELTYHCCRKHSSL